MKRTSVTIFLCLIFGIAVSANEIGNKLMKYYSETISEVDSNYVYFKDGSKFLLDDKKEKSFEEMLENPDIEDMFYYKYPKGKLQHPPALNEDAGRIRNSELAAKLYGANKTEIRKNLVSVLWLDGRSLLFQKRYGASDALNAVIAELKNLPDSFMTYLNPCMGTFNYRKIAQTERLSPHSYGIAIDINTKKSDYWLWSKGKYQYRNRIPNEIVSIFEKYGFIWGGKWYHYDTMHFEYRPELF